MDPLTKDDVLQMRSFAPSRPAALLLQTLAETGLRIGEVRALTPGDVRIDNSYRPRRTWIDAVRLKKAELRVVQVPVEIELAESLRDYAGGQGLGPDDPLWPWRDPASFYRIIRGMGFAALGRSVNPHMLRAYFIRMVAMETGQVAVASELVGHASLQTTMRYFTMTFEERAKLAKGAAL